jgi:hypothetical protein
VYSGGREPEVLAIYALTRETSVTLIDDYGSELRRLKSMRARFKKSEAANAPPSSFLRRMRDNTKNSYAITQQTWLRCRLRWFSSASREKAERELDELLTKDDMMNTKPPKYQTQEYERYQPPKYSTEESDKYARVDYNTTEAYGFSQYVYDPMRGHEDELKLDPIGFECASAPSDSDLIDFEPPPEMDLLFKPVYPNTGINKPDDTEYSPEIVPPHIAAEIEEIIVSVTKSAGTEPKKSGPINKPSIATLRSEHQMRSGEIGAGFNISF